MSDKEDPNESFVPCKIPLYRIESQESGESPQKESHPDHSEPRGRWEGVSMEQKPDAPNKLTLNMNFGRKGRANSNELENVFLIENEKELFKFMLGLINPKDKKRKVPALDFLEIRQSHLTDAVFPMFAKDTKILKIRECRMTDFLAGRLAKHRFALMTKLDLRHNLLTEVPCLDLPNLLVLNLSQNRLSKFDVNNFDRMSLLEDLDLSHNLLDFGLTAFKELMMDTGTCLPRLTKLSLLGNPLCASIDVYQQVVLLQMYERLDYLDGSPVEREAFREKYNQVKKEVYALELRKDRRPGAEAIKLPFSFLELTALINASLDMPNVVLNNLNELKYLVDVLVRKSAKNSFVFRYEMRNNENSLKKDLADFLERVQIMMDQHQHSNAFLFDILAKMTLLRQENCNISLAIFDKLLSLVEQSEEYRENIVHSIRQECLADFCSESLLRLDFQKLSKLNQVVALTESVNELLGKDASSRLEGWLEQLLEAGFVLGIELKDYLILADFFCLTLCRGCPPSDRFAGLMRRLFETLGSKLKHADDSDQEPVSVFVFFLKVCKNWLGAVASESPLHAQPLQTDSHVSATPLYWSSSSTSHPRAEGVRSGGHFLLGERLFGKFVAQVWRFFKQIQDSEAKFYDNLQQRVNLEILNSCFCVLSELLKSSACVALDGDPYNFHGGLNLFTQVFSSANGKIKSLEFKTIVLNFAFKLFKNE